MSPATNPAPASEARIQANRENAKKSTGPRTESGKAASRRNALKHGLTAQLLLRHDDKGLYRELLADLYHRYQPATVLERIAVSRIAFDIVRLDALILAHTGLPPAAAEPAMETASDAPFLGGIFTSVAANKQAYFVLLSRYENTLQNSLQRDIRHLDELRDSRPDPAIPAPDASELPEPEAPPEPVAAADPIAVETKPIAAPRPAPSPSKAAFDIPKPPAAAPPDRPRYFIG